MFDIEKPLLKWLERFVQNSMKNGEKAENSSSSGNINLFQFYRYVVVHLFKERVKETQRE